MSRNAKVPIFVPILLGFVAAYFLIAPSFGGFGLEPVASYLFGGSFLVCVVAYFLLKEHQRIAISYVALFLMMGVIVWALRDQEGYMIPIAFIPCIVALMNLNKQVRDAKQA